MSPACRASNDAIPPVWWRSHRQACHARVPARGEERRQLARSQQFRMQFDWVNFQQYLQTLQFQRYGRAARHSVGGIACDIRGKLTGRDSCATTHSTASSTAGSAATGAGGGLAQRPGTVDTVAANDLPKPHRDRPRDHAQTHNLTTTSNTNFPARTSRKVTTEPTYCPLTQLFRKATGLERCLRDTLSGSRRSHRDKHSTTIP